MHVFSRKWVLKENGLWKGFEEEENNTRKSLKLNDILLITFPYIPVYLIPLFNDISLTYKKKKKGFEVWKENMICEKHDYVINICEKVCMRTRWLSGIIHLTLWC